jgi:predicted nucleic acid-binding protein
MNGDRFFLDTNVFVYCFDDKAVAKRATAIQLIEVAITSRLGAVSTQVVQEFCNVMVSTKLRSSRPADLDFYLDATFEPLLSVYPSLPLFHNCLWLQERYRLAWYDALIVAAAQQARCKLLYSEELQHGAEYGAVRVENPFR